MSCSFRDHALIHRHRFPCVVLLLALIVCFPMAVEPATAQTSKNSNSSKSKGAKSRPRSKSSSRKSTTRKDELPEDVKAARDFKSRHFLVHTDLTSAEARDLLKRLETMLSILKKYWGQPCRKVIEMYVVRDLSKFPVQSMNPNGVARIAGRGGVTISSTQTLRGVIVDADAIVYAVAERGVPQHEAVHAYCRLTFGRTGPIWYSEGMAEMGQYFRIKNPRAVHCHPYVVKYIHSSPPKSLNEIINSNETTGDSWQNYAWRWALCHLLNYNPNYSARFRPLGLDLLNNKGTTFERVYGSMADEISFEYLFFLEHFDVGYRADLCAWDWKARFTRPRGKGSLSSRIEAGRGWQPARMRVKAGEEIEYAAEGTWKTGPAKESVDADGEKDGSAKLIGVVFNDYKLGKPFELGTFGSFAAPSDGKLFLRCNDMWAQIADNTGRMSVKVKVKGVGSPLKRPERKTKSRSLRHKKASRK